MVYEGKSRKFYHWDSLGGMNDKYVEGLVRELLVHILPNTDFSKYLVHKHDIRQNNGYDCGVAVIAIIKRIIRLWNQNWLDWIKYGRFKVGDDLGEFDFKKEREELRKEYLEDNE